ncbi:MAG: polyprenyl synthetase family protein [Porphyromonas sp.]|nr:polyprenyl synthetase family protein [Porphyromonas sp.]
MTPSISQNPFEQYLLGLVPSKEPQTLFRPVSYTLEVAGKRIRPRLVLQAYEMMGGQDLEAEAYPVAAAVEVFHNFTLLHDDLMDDAASRRHRETVWKKWNPNTAILSGDAMLVLAYEILEQSKASDFRALQSMFSKTAREVCMGQQYDMDFETRDASDVGVDQYMEMIRLKTSVLLGGALALGAIAAGASKENIDTLYQIGVTTGLAFQLQDDYLDTFGDEATFGKPIGGDIIERKKTFLMIQTAKIASSRGETAEWQAALAVEDKAERIERVREFYIRYEVDKLIRDMIKGLSKQAVSLSEQLNVPNREPLKELIDMINSLSERNH